MHNKWVIALACCCVNILILGTGRLSPLLFVACLERFNSDRGRTSFPFILCYLLRTLSGPLIGYLGAKFGSRSVTIAGGLVAAIGVCSCFFAEDILAITLLFGVVYGLGFGFASSLIPHVLSQHFQEKLAVASGMAYVGSSIGGAILPPIADISMNAYGVSGMFLIIGAIILNSIPCAMLLVNPVSPTKTVTEKEDVPKTQETLKCEQDSQNPSPVTNKTAINDFYEPQLEHTSKLEGITNKAFETNHEDAFSDNANNFGLLRVKRRTSSVLEQTPETPVLVSYTANDTTDKLKTVGNRKMSRRLSSVFEMTMATPVFLQYDSTKRSSILYVGKSILQDTTDKQIEPEESGIGSFQIFSNPVFLVICFIQSSFTFYLTVVWTVLIDFVKDKDIDQDKEMIFLICSPVADTMGRLLMGFVVDAGFLSETNFCSVCYLLLSLTCCMMAWFTTYSLTLVATLTNAFVSGAVLITFPGMIVGFIDAKHRSMAMASRLIMYAPMAVAESPLIEFFRGNLGSYNGLFYLLGALHGLCCLLIHFMPKLARRRNNKRMLIGEDLNQSPKV